MNIFNGIVNDETILAHREMSFRTHCADKLRDLSSNCHVDGDWALIG